MAERKRPETKAQHPQKGLPGEPESGVSINREAFESSAIHGTSTKVNGLYREIRATLRKLNCNPKGVAPLSPCEESGTHPGLLDVKRWLDSLTSDSSDLEWLCSVYNTLEQRVSPDYKKKLILSED